MMTVIEEAMALGLTEQKACEAMGISVRRFQDWRQRAQSGEYERRSKSSLTRPFNALTPAESKAIERAVGHTEWADLSCRELSIKLMEFLMSLFGNTKSNMAWPVIGASGD